MGGKQKVKKLGHAHSQSHYPSVGKTELAGCEVLTEAELVQKHDRLVRALAYRFTAVDAEDLVQVGRLALVQAARTWKGRAQFWTYAQRAVFLAMLNYTTREVAHFGAPLDVETTAGAGARPDLAIEIRECLEQLTPDELDFTILRVWGEWDVRAIASFFGRSKSDIHRVLQGARAKMRARAGAA